MPQLATSSDNSLRPRYRSINALCTLKELLLKNNKLKFIKCLFFLYRILCGPRSFIAFYYVLFLIFVVIQINPKTGIHKSQIIGYPCRGAISDMRFLHSLINLWTSLHEVIACLCRECRCDKAPCVLELITLTQARTVACSQRKLSTVSTEWTHCCQLCCYALYSLT